MEYNNLFSTRVLKDFPENSSSQKFSKKLLCRELFSQIKTNGEITKKTNNFFRVVNNGCSTGSTQFEDDLQMTNETEGGLRTHFTCTLHI